MDWYVVVKTINGRRYFYAQKTYRDGPHVRTLNRYIGPSVRTACACGKASEASQKSGGGIARASP